MLFSQTNLLTNTNDVDNNMERLEFERISSYVKEQELYADLYHSPNHHTASDDSFSKDSSVIIIDNPNTSNPKNDTGNKKSKPEEYHDDDFSLFSASISQVIERKIRQTQQEKRSMASKHSVIRLPSPTTYQKDIDTMPKQDTNNSKYIKTQEDLSLSASSIYHEHQQKHHSAPRKRRNLQNNQHHHRKLSGSKVNDTALHHDKRMKLPQTKANGFHLLHKFISPNLEVDRITIKPHDTNKHPKLGLFNKGKSSSKATGAVPDLVFSESKFLEKNNRNTRDYTSNSYVSSNYSQHNTNIKSDRKKQHCVSKYFRPKAQQHQHYLNDNTLKENKFYQNSSSSSHYFHKYPNNTSSHTPSRIVLAKPRRESSDQNQKYAVPSLSSPLHNYTTLSNDAPIAMDENRVKGATVYSHMGTKSNTTPIPKNSKGLLTLKKTKKDNTSIASSSNETIEKILKECKNAPQVSSFDYKHQNQDQRYSHKRLYERINDDKNNAIARKPNDFHYMNQVPSYSRVKTPASGAAEHTLNSNIKRQEFDKEPILIESSDDDGSRLLVIPPNHLLIEKDEDMCHNTTPTSSMPEEYDENSLHQYRTYTYEDENGDNQFGLDTQTSQHQEGYFSGISRYYDDGLLEEWQIENSIISFSDEEDGSGNNCLEYVANEFSKDEGVLPLQIKNKKKPQIESILNFWKDQYKRSL